MAVDTSIHNELRSDFYEMEQEIHSMVDGVHNLEDEISKELQESKELENLLSKVLHEIEDLKQKDLAIERLEQKATENDVTNPGELSDEEQEIAEEMFQELHTLAKDIDTSRALINELKQRDDGVRENVTKLGEIDEQLENGQEKLVGDEEGLLQRLEALSFNNEIKEDWIRSLENRYKE